MRHNVTFKQRLFSAGALVIGCVALPVWAESNTLAPSVALPAERAEYITNLVKQDCGSCHGLTLQGGLGPALTVNALKDKPSAMLVDTILQGRMNTAMPPWKRFFSQDEAQWIVDSLKSGSFQ